MSRLRLRGPLAVLILCLITVSIISLLYLNSNDLATHGSSNSSMRGHDKVQQMDTFNVDTFNVDPSLVTGERIMPELGDATARAELGRATWKLIHTMASRYPLEPKPDERAAVKQWIMLLSRLYPCGECAEHFQKLLKEHPPQTSSRSALSNWACAVHNIVNERLGKPEFDCTTLADVYKCGCADEAKEEKEQRKE
ncbi:MAG: ERV/ALR sulfhydryl oxidase domain-containing protein [Benniella sp.]|nr:MAG: ERV/ALR sulfhydryl oxidase domain-containing protein [Benniella sp.]